MAKSDDLKDENLDPRKLVGIPASATAWQAHMGHQEEGLDRVESKIKILVLALE